MNIATIAGHLAFGLIAFSFLVKDILWLRLVSVLASLFSIFYNWVIPIEPMWIAIGWNFIFILLNLYHIAVIIYEKRPVQMSPKHKELYETMFKGMTPVEFLKITKIADWVHFKSGEVIILSKEEDLPIIVEALEILIEDIENDMIDNSWNSQYRQELLVKLNELYERL